MKYVFISFVFVNLSYLNKVSFIDTKNKDKINKFNYQFSAISPFFLLK